MKNIIFKSSFFCFYLILVRISSLWKSFNPILKMMAFRIRSIIVRISIIAGPIIIAPEACAKSNPKIGRISRILICCASLKPLTLEDIVTVNPIAVNAIVGAKNRISNIQFVFGKSNLPSNSLKDITSTLMQ